MQQQNIRNIAIIAHVDHGKTTLVDKILHQSHLFRENQVQQDLILDNNDQERERGITILAKNVSVRYKDVKINIIDTPGHSDFGGEVERVLNMADGVILLVDAFEGPMPQTRFVLQKALSLGLKPIIVVNKVDKPNCTPEETHEKVLELMLDLGATDDQFNAPVAFGSSKAGWMGPDWKTPTEDVSYLLDLIIKHIPAPEIKEGPLQMQISSLDYSSYQGRIAIGRIYRGSMKAGQSVAVMKANGTIERGTIKELYTFEGLGKEKCKTEIKSGEICAILGLDTFDIGDTVADPENPEELKRIHVDEPTMSMLFTINNSPFFGKDGKFVTSRHIRERLFKETEKNLALRVEETDSPERLQVYGRGILHLAVLVESMRREGYELQLGQPKVIIKEEDGVKYEPVEILNVEVPETLQSRVIDIVSRRKGDLLNVDSKNDRSFLEFVIPSRGIIGLTNPLLTATEGEAVISHRFKDFEPWRGELSQERKSSLIAKEPGESTPYSLNELKDRGRFFINPGEEVYTGQIIGETPRQDDIVVNVCTKKKLSNMRASGSDEKVVLEPATKFSLEECMEYIKADEYVEVTPHHLRLRKIILDEIERKRANRASNNEN